MTGNKIKALGKSKLVIDLERKKINNTREMGISER